nr:MAG TPA: hypothetical protein [Caudoviricetes sp.]
MSCISDKYFRCSGFLLFYLHILFQRSRSGHKEGGQLHTVGKVM